MEPKHKTEAERTALAETILDKVMDEMNARFSAQACSECGSKGITATDIANYLKFLKDNGFDVHRKQSNSALEELIANRRGEPLLPKDPTLN